MSPRCAPGWRRPRGSGTLQRAELDFYRRQAAQVDPANETPEQRYQRERAQIRTEVEAQIRTETFHQQGATQFNDWKQRCDDLHGDGRRCRLCATPGRDAGRRERVKVAAALAVDPDAVQRIANLRSERARAVALGRYAAGIEDVPADRPTRVNGGAAAPAPAVTRAPAPIRPVTGRVSPTFSRVFGQRRCNWRTTTCARTSSSSNAVRRA